jgi:hypothetical protein
MPGSWFIMGVLFSLLQNPPSQGILVDKIVVVVNDKQIITLSEIKEALASKPLRFLLDSQGTPTERKVFDYLIENKLILEEIGYLSHRHVEPLELEVALSWMMKLQGRNDTSSTVDDFRKTLEEKGFSIDTLNRFLEMQLRGIEYIQRKNRFTADIQDPKKVLQLYEDWLTELKKKGDIRYLE